MPATQELLNQGRYRIEHPLSDGDGTNVFNAYDTVSNVNVVVKEIPVKLGKVTTLSQQENNKTAFTDQARQLKDLRHDNLLNVEDYFFEVGRQYLVLEAVEGKTLAAFLKEHTGPVEFGGSAAWIGQLLSAIEFLSSRTPGFVHGKISPENIHIDGNGRLKLLSVGMSGDSDTSVDTSLNGTREGSTNLCYSPLEMIWDSLDGASQKVISNSYDETSVGILHQPPDARSDVYSIGAVFYRLLTGAEPVDALERSIELLESNPDPLVAPTTLNPELAKEFSDLILKAVALKREDRFDSSAVMHQVLKTTLLRIKERGEEAHEEAEAAIELKKAVVDRNDEVQKLLEAKKREFEAEKARQEELLQAKLREAEEMRLDAERRAAEAERLLRAQEEVKPVAPSIDPEEDLLGIASVNLPSTDQAEVKVAAESTHTGKPGAVTEAATPVPNISKTTEHAATVKANSKKEKAATKPSVDTAKPSGSMAVEESSTAVYVTESISTEDVAVPSFGSYESSDIFSEPKKRFPLMAVAGGVTLIIVIAIGGWVFLSRSKPAPVVAQPVVPQVAEQVQQPVEAAPAETTVAPVENAFIEPQVETAQPDNPTKVASAVSPEKKKAAVADPAKAKPATPKKVTVDDLINDN